MPPTVTLLTPSATEIAEGRVSPATPLQFKIQPGLHEGITAVEATVNGVSVYADGVGINGWYGALREISAPIIPPPMSFTLYSPTGFEYNESVSIDLDVQYSEEEG